jgi:hypothetical protein
MQKHHDVLQEDNGDIITSATVTVFLANTGTPASIFEDDEITALSNPFTVSDSNYDSDGSFWFKAANGTYDIKTVNGAVTKWKYDVSLFDADNIIEIYANIAALRAITAIPPIIDATIRGYYDDDDGGANPNGYYWDTSSTETDDGLSVFKATAITTGRWKANFSGEVNFKWAGAKGDGSTDDSTAFDNATDYIDATGEWLNITPSSGDYILATAITKASLSKPLKIRGNDVSKLKYTGSNTNYVFIVSATNGHDIFLDNLHIDANLKAAVCFRATNNSASMSDSDIGRFDARGGSYKNGYLSTGLTTGSTGIFLRGGFSVAKYDDVYVYNMSRDTGAGVSGSLGSVGLATSSISINAYVKKHILIDGCVDLITNNETTGHVDDVDCDGVKFSGRQASDNNNEHIPSTFISRGTTFKNCKGRSIKTQLDGYSIVTDFTIIRDLEEAINNGQEIDFQYGGGNFSDGIIYYYETATSGTTLGTSHALANYSPDQLATANDAADGGLIVKDITIYNDISISVDTLPFAVTVSNSDTTKSLTGITVDNINMVGGGISRVLSTTGGTTEETNIEVSNFSGNLTVALVLFNDNVNATMKLVAMNNKNTGGGTPELVQLQSNTSPMLSAAGNSGFVENYKAVSTANTIGQIFRGELLGGDAIDGHTVSLPQTITLADDATHVFSATGNFGFGIITNNFGDSTQVMFTHQSNRFIEQTVTSADVTFGTTSNPDVDGDLNIWISGGAINIKNRLGSSRVFHFIHIGG